MTELITCPWCGQWTRLEMVRSHLECPVCRRVVYDCCDGDHVGEKTDEETTVTGRTVDSK